MNKKRNKCYDRVMSRVNNRSRTSLISSSNVTRHDIPSSVRLGAKPSVSNVSSSIFSDLPTVLNDYIPESSREKVKKSNVVKPKRTLKSLDPPKSPTRTPAKAKDFRGHYRGMRTQGSVPSVVTRDGNGWSENHVRQCYSSRSHTRLKDLKDEIKAYQETEKLMKLRSNLYKKCGVVLDDVGNVAKDKATQSEIEGPDKEKEQIRFPNDPYLKEKWMDATGSKDWFPTKYSTICSIHFNEESYAATNKCRMLTKTAYPTIDILKTTSNEEDIDQEPTSNKASLCDMPNNRKLDQDNNKPSTSNKETRQLLHKLNLAQQKIKQQNLKVKRLREQNRRKTHKIQNLVALILELKRNY